MRTRRLFAGMGLGALVLLAACCGAAFFLARTHALAGLYNDLVLDNYDHSVPCGKLPTSAEVHRIVEENQDTVQAIEAVNQGFVWLEIDDSFCPGRADIVIYYASHRDRLAIEKILSGKTFLGVPCRFRNV